MINSLISVVQEAGRLTQEIKNKPGELERTAKLGDWDFATLADIESQKLIISRLKAEFPEIAIVAEEDENPTIKDSSFFVVDPIDGTAPYNHKRDGWGITIAYVEGYQPKVGVIILPDRNILVTAEKGKGAFLNGNKLQFTHSRPLIETLVGTELGPWVDAELYRKLVIPVSDNCMGIICTRSAVASAVELLEEKSGVYFNMSIPMKGAKIWDFAAAALAVQEAGGVAVGMDGKPLVWDKVPMEALFAANQQLADEVLELIQL